MAAGSEAERALAVDPGIEQVRRQRICVMLGDGWSRTFFGRHGIDFEEGRDTENCLRHLDKGRQDLFIHVTASVLRHIREADLQGRIVMLPHVYDRVPLALLLSKRSPLGRRFLEAFDRELDAMVADGSHARLIEDLRQRGP